MFAFYADYESAEKLKFLLFNPNTSLEGRDGGDFRANVDNSKMSTYK